MTVPAPSVLSACFAAFEARLRAEIVEPMLRLARDFSKLQSAPRSTMTASFVPDRPINIYDLLRTRQALREGAVPTAPAGQYFAVLPPYQVDIIRRHELRRWLRSVLAAALGRDGAVLGDLYRGHRGNLPVVPVPARLRRRLVRGAALLRGGRTDWSALRAAFAPLHDAYGVAGVRPIIQRSGIMELVGSSLHGAYY